MLTQVCNEWLTAKMPCSTKMWLEKLYRKRLITSALRKDLLLFRDRNLTQIEASSNNAPEGQDKSSSFTADKMV